jgi:hypothetical protein
MSATTLLTELARELAAGSIRVIDLTQPLNSDAQVIGLPPHWEYSALQPPRNFPL